MSRLLLLSLFTRSATHTLTSNPIIRVCLHACTPLEDCCFGQADSSLGSVPKTLTKALGFGAYHSDCSVCGPRHSQSTAIKTLMVHVRKMNTPPQTSAADAHAISRRLACDVNLLQHSQDSDNATSQTGGLATCLRWLSYRTACSRLVWTIPRVQMSFDNALPSLKPSR